MFEDVGASDFSNEGDFDRTVAFLEMDSDEVLAQLEESIKVHLTSIFFLS